MRSLALLLLLVPLCSSSSVCLQQPCAPTNIEADFVFLIDTSNAFEPDEFEQVRSFLSDFSNLVTVDKTRSQFAFISYGKSASSAGKLNELNTPDAVAAAIAGLTRQDFDDRDLQSALTLEAGVITTDNGLRADAEKLLILLLGDAWTGKDVFTDALTATQAKYNAVLVIGVGIQPIDNAYNEIRRFAGVDSNVFFAFDISQLPYVQLWLANGACPGAHNPPTTVAPTVVPTPNPSIGCDLRGLDTDIYLIVDTSSVMSGDDFEQLKQTLYSFIAVFPLAQGETQFGLVTTYSDSQLYYTGINSPSIDRGNLLHTIETLQQELVDGQTFYLSLQAVEQAYLIPSKAANKLLVYFTANTNFDKDPTAYLGTLHSTYGLQTLTVRWAATADATALQNVAGGTDCVLDATTAAARTTVNDAIEKDICSKTYCR